MSRDDATARLRAAQRMLAKGSLDAARTELLRVLEDGVSRPALESLATSALLSGLPAAEAAHDLLARVESFPKESLLRFALGTAQLSAGDPSSALRSFRIGASLDATDVDTRLAWAQLAHQAGDAATASQICVEALRLSPHRSDVWILSGRVAHSVGQRDVALTAFRQALLVDPSNAEATALLRGSAVEPSVREPASPTAAAAPDASLDSIRAQVRRAYETNAKARFERDANSWWVLHVIRPSSLWVSPWFVQARVTPNQVTWSGFGLGLLVCTLLASGHPAAGALGSLLYFAQVVLDYVDGNLARYYKRTSHYGKFLDGSTEIFFLALFHASLGIGAARQLAGSPGLAAAVASLGGVTGALFVVRTYLELRYDAAVTSLKQRPAGDAEDGIVTNVGERRRLRADACARAKRALIRIEGEIRIPLLFAAAATGHLVVFVTVAAAFVGGACITSAAALLMRGKSELDAFRPY